MDYSKLQNGSDIRGVALEGIEGQHVNLTEDVCKNMSFLGIEIDEEVNKASPRGEFADITAKGAKVKTLVIPTNEEYMIALDTQNLTK